MFDGIDSFFLLKLSMGIFFFNFRRYDDNFLNIFFTTQVPVPCKCKDGMIID